MRQDNRSHQGSPWIPPPLPGGCAPQTPSRIGRLGSAKLRGGVNFWVGMSMTVMAGFGVMSVCAIRLGDELDKLKQSLGGCSLQVDSKSPSPYRFLTCPQAPFEKVYINQGFGPALDTLAFQSRQACEMFETPDGQGAITYTVECDKSLPTPPAPARIEPTPEPQKFIDKRRKR